MEPTSPTTKASASTERFTCFFDAPIARSRASSRLRWATRIEKVLMIRKVPTTIAIAAKTSRKVLRKPRTCDERLLAVLDHLVAGARGDPFGQQRYGGVDELLLRDVRRRR